MHACTCVCITHMYMCMSEGAGACAHVPCLGTVLHNTSTPPPPSVKYYYSNPLVAIRMLGLQQEDTRTETKTGYYLPNYQHSNSYTMTVMKGSL